MEKNHCLAYIGSFAEQAEKIGISILDVNPDTGEIRVAGMSEKIEKPAYLALSADGKHLYATIETHQYDGLPGGGAASFVIDRDGGLTLQSRQPTYGALPCYISVDHANTTVFVSNYDAGTAAVYQLAPDGSLLPNPRIFTHSGSGPDPLRQKHPYAHCAVLSPDERYLCVCDLGLDKVMLYDFSGGKGDMALAGKLSVSPGDGPRHIVFNASGDRAYVLSEMGCQVFVFSYDRNDGSFLPLQTISTLPPGISGSFCSAIRFTPDGRLLMASNRGHDSITVFQVLQDGQLQAIAHNPTLGQTPRDFNITPNGKFVIVGNQDSNELRVFSLNAVTGLFSFTGCRLEIPSPVCVVFSQPDGEPVDESHIRMKEVFMSNIGQTLSALKISNAYLVANSALVHDGFTRLQDTAIDLLTTRPELNGRGMGRVIFHFLEGYDKSNFMTEVPGTDRVMCPTQERALIDYLRYPEIQEEEQLLQAFLDYAKTHDKFDALYNVGAFYSVSRERIDEVIEESYSLLESE